MTMLQTRQLARQALTWALICALWALPVPANAQTSSWSSRVEAGRVTMPPSPPGTHVIPQPAAPKRTIAPGGAAGRGATRLRQGNAPATLPRPIVPQTGENAAYLAFDNAQFLTALKLAEEAAKTGQPEAHTLVGRIHGEGHGVPRNLALAAHWFHRAAELGDAEGAFALGLMYVSGQGVEKNHSHAAALFERAAATGHVYANYNLGLMFLSGLGKPENPIRGARHVMYAAEKGVAAAQYDLATLHINGHGVPADGYLASRWLRQAAALGMAEAQFDYAIMLLRGLGLNEDRVDAVRYLRSAAEQGLAAAQNRLAHVLTEGAGVSRDIKEGAKWRLIAAQQGVVDEKLDRVVRQLPGADRAAAEAAASLWLERASVGAAQQ